MESDFFHVHRGYKMSRMYLFTDSDKQTLDRKQEKINSTTQYILEFS